MRRLTKGDIERIHELRYEDGLTCPEVAAIMGCGIRTVGNHAPGWIGKVPNAPLREAFLASGMSAGDVARRMGWMHTSGADGSRVKRTLGLLPDISGSRGWRSVRTLIDAETAGLMAEALGLMAWEIMPAEDLELVAA